MKYPIAIEPGSDTQAWGVAVPDLPGCFSAADESIGQAIENAQEAIALWIESTIDNGEPIPAPSTITALQANSAYQGWIWAVVEKNKSPGRSLASGLSASDALIQPTLLILHLCRHAFNVSRQNRLIPRHVDTTH
jgi:predicted RNase H-like HicB family nuclease